MEILPEDERNIRYFAKIYSCKECPKEDLLQEGRLAVLLSKEPSHKYIAMRLAIQEFARRAKLFHKTQRGHKDLRTDTIVATVDDENLMRMERGEYIRTSIEKAKLSKREKECFLLNTFGDKSIEEIARELSINYNTVRSHIGRAKKKIKRSMLCT